MTNKLPEQMTASFSEEQTRKILARASELDRLLAGRLSVTAIRDAALEAGISEAAIEQAIREASPATTAVVKNEESPSWKARVMDWAQVAATGGLAYTIGLTARLLEPTRIWGREGWHFAEIPSEPTFVAVIVAMLMSLLLAYDSRRERSVLRFHVLNLLVWVGFALGWVVFLKDDLPSYATQDLLEMLAMAGSFAAALGTLIVLLRVSLRRPEADFSPSASAVGAR